MDRFERAGQAFAELCRIMARLRAPDGCPWDREQTLASLRPYLIEEAYEVLDAMDSQDPAALREELGDLLLQIVFQAQVTCETGGFDAADVAAGISAKLVQRHPHVFGDVHAEDAGAALRSWEAVKAREQAKKKRGRLDGVPGNLPGLLRATRTSEKAAAGGLAGPDAASAAAQISELWQGLVAGLAKGSTDSAARLGALLFLLADLGRRHRIDAEDALRSTIDAFTERFRRLEAELSRTGRTNQNTTSEELAELWQVLSPAGSPTLPKP